jgi:hypothetical protein
MQAGCSIFLAKARFCRIYRTNGFACSCVQTTISGAIPTCYVRDVLLTVRKILPVI